MKDNIAFKPTLWKPFKSDIYGFDIETYGNKNKFLLCSIYKDDEDKKTFFSKDDFFDWLKKDNHNHDKKIIFATNLSFDFFGILKDDEAQNFRTLFRDSSLIRADTYLQDKRLNSIRDRKKAFSKIEFYDTINYAPFSVEKLGNIMDIKKLSLDGNIGKKPKNDEELKLLIDYNMRDSEISKKAGLFLLNSFNKLGSNFKMTIASTSMSLYKNRFLKDTYYRHPIPLLLEEFKYYYGGRTEIFSRGKIDKNHNYYDVNSLYPSVMVGEYPNPNKYRVNNKDTIFYIENFDGLADVTVKTNGSYYPLLPLRDKKLLFPNGTFRGCYTNVEIRKAISEGYEILNVHRNIYFEENVFPFKDFVSEMYELRNKYKKENNPLEIVVKLILNSLYGKFGSKFTDKDNWIHKDALNYDDVKDIFEIIGNYARIKKDITNPPSYTIPVWATYTTAYARLKLHDLLKKSDAIYCDTDSIITLKDIEVSSRLGELKKEYKIKEGIFIKPKFYGFRGINQKNEEVEVVTMKGVPKKILIDEDDRKKEKLLDYNLFSDIIKNKNVDYNKFIKFKESLRRNLDINEIKEIHKEFTMEDDKRLWSKKFDIEDIQKSEPLII